MISNYIIAQQRLVVILDHIGLDLNEQKFFESAIHEQGKYKIKTLAVNSSLKQDEALDEFIKECNEDDTLGGQWNAIIPDFANLLCYQKPGAIFPFLKRLQNCKHVERILFWVTVPSIAHKDVSYLVAAIEYMAQLIIHIETDKELRIITRKPGGAVTNKRFSYVQTTNEFKIEPLIVEEKHKNVDEDQYKISNFGTFKIELEEEELVARNALKLPYEKSSENSTGNIIYTLEANDDFDDEDVDFDLMV